MELIYHENYLEVLDSSFMPEIEFNESLTSMFVPKIPDPLQGEYTRKV